MVLVTSGRPRNTFRRILTAANAASISVTKSTSSTMLPRCMAMRLSYAGAWTKGRAR